MTSSTRSSGYTNEENIHLCHVYFDISQNPILVIYHSRDQFWTRVQECYNNTMLKGVTQVRSKKSLQTRMQTILSAINKLRGYIRQIEYLNPSGASEQDIVSIHFK